MTESSERKRKFIHESTKKKPKACTFVTYATKTLIQFRNYQTIPQLIWKQSLSAPYVAK